MTASPARDFAALVPAAGSGERLGLGPKAFLELGGETLLARVARILAQAVGRVLVAVPADRVERARAEVAGRAEVHAGGASRLRSIRGLLERCREEFVLVHDVARPFASAELCARVAAATREHGAAGAFQPALVGGGRAAGGFVTASIPSGELRQPQSPHGYRREVLERACRHADALGVEPQSTWELVLLLGIPIREVAGEPENVKVTVPFDWEVARAAILPALAAREGRA